MGWVYNNAVPSAQGMKKKSGWSSSLARLWNKQPPRLSLRLDRLGDVSSSSYRLPLCAFSQDGPKTQVRQA